MEHRYSQRFRRSFQVLIYERGLPVSTGRATNSSRDGFFIESSHAVKNNQPIEIEVIDQHRRVTNHSAKNRRIPCFVVHSQDYGFGVEMHEDHINKFGAVASIRQTPDKHETIAETKFSHGL